jgi:hydroxypyruvate isomerase
MGIPNFSACIEMLFADLPFVDRVTASAEAGLKAVEFWGWHGKDLDGISERAARDGVTVACFVGNGEGDLCDPEAHSEWVAGAVKSLEQADKYGVRTLIVTTGNELADVARRRQHQAIVEGLDAVATRAEEMGVTLVLEPLNVLVDHAGYYLVTSGEGFEIVDEVDSPNVKLLYDIYHQQVTEGNLIATITANIAKIGHFHCADVPGRYEPGTGEINYANVFKVIADSDYDGHVGLECRSSVSSEATIAKVLAIAGQD